MINFDSDNYCVLHICEDKNVNKSDIRIDISEIINGNIKSNYVFDEFSYFDIKNNKLIFVDQEFTSWPIRVEIYPIDNSIDQSEQIYRAVVSEVVMKLRSQYGYKVVAVCEFEDEIIEKTGWNWTDSTPIHP